MKNTFLIACIAFGSVLYAQQQVVVDQNPNHQKAYQKYAAISNQYIVQQGTTAQETYVAIDPMEEKRIRKKIRKDHRAKRSLWRHKERLARAKNTRYYQQIAPRRFPFWNGIGIGFGYRPFNGCSFNIR